MTAATPAKSNAADAPTPKTSAARLAAARVYKIKNRERLLKQQSQYNAARIADPVRHARKLEQDRISRKKHYEKRLAYDRARDKQKTAARVKIRHAIEEGRLIRQPCEKCGLPNAHAHHDDYSKPLDVRWLCPKHHKEAHRE